MSPVSNGVRVPNQDNNEAQSNGSSLRTVLDILKILSGNAIGIDPADQKSSSQAKDTMAANAQTVAKKGLKDALLEAGGSMTLGELRRKFPYLVGDVTKRLHGEKRLKIEGSESSSGASYDYYAVAFYIDGFAPSMDSDSTVIHLNRMHHESSFLTPPGPGSSYTESVKDYSLD